MTRLGPALLVGLGLLLASALAALWVDPTTLQLRDAQWQPPAAREPDFTAMVPLLPPRAAPPASEFAATLQRPLFAPNRRPAVPLPPPAPPKAEPAPVVAVKPPPDPLAEVKILGMYAGAQSGGIIAMVDGKARRAHLNEKINDWTITSIGDREVTFSQAGSTRVLPLEVRRPANAAGAAQTPPAAARDISRAPLAPAPAVTSAPATRVDPFVFAGQPPTQRVPGAAGGVTRTRP